MGVRVEEVDASSTVAFLTLRIPDVCFFDVWKEAKVARLAGFFCICMSVGVSMPD
jgi:hypothetical protein